MSSRKLDRIVNGTGPGSFATRMRRRRFKLFELMVHSIGRKGLRVIDLGGTVSYWNQVYDVSANPLHLEITILNTEAGPPIGSGFRYIRGDARRMEGIGDKSYDVCFSNSMLEHVGDFTQQFLAVSEMKRVATYLYLQTPSFSFPFEPHYRLLLVHWLPFPVRMKVLSLLSGGSLGHDYYLRDSINLLTRGDLAYFFDERDYRIESEKSCLMTKSYVVLSRIPPPAAASPSGLLRSGGATGPGSSGDGSAT